METASSQGQRRLFGPEGTILRKGPIIERAMAAFLVLSLLLFVFVDFILNIQYSSLTQLYDSIPDEALFFGCANHLADHIRSGDLHGIAGFGTPYGYGFPYWIISALLLLVMPSALASKLATLKAVFLSFKWLGILTLTQTINKRRVILRAAIFFIAIQSCSIFYFYGKVFSPEFLTLLLGCFTVSILVSDDFKAGYRLPIAFFLVTLCVLIKATNIPLAILLVGYIALCPIGLRGGGTMACAFAALIAFGIAFSGLLTPDAMAMFSFWMKSNLYRKFGLEHLFIWITYRGVTWDRIPLSGGIGVLGVLGAAIVWCIGKPALKSAENIRSVGLLSAATGLIGMFLILMFDGYLDWYIQLPVVLCVFGFIYSAELSGREAVVAGMIICITFAASIHETYMRTQIRLDVQNQLKESSIANTVFDAELNNFKNNNNLEPFIITDLLIALSPSDKSAQIYRARDVVTNIFEKRKGAPSFILASLGKDIDFSKATHIILNETLAARNESPLLNFRIVKKEDDLYFFQGEKFRKVDERAARLLLLNTRFVNFPPVPATVRQK